MVNAPSKRKSCFLNDKDGGADDDDIRRTSKALKLVIDPVDQDRPLEEEQQEDDGNVVPEEDIYIPLNDVSSSKNARRIRYRYESELPLNKWWRDEEEGGGDKDSLDNIDNKQELSVHGNRQSRRRRCRRYNRKDRNELLLDNIEALMSCLDVSNDDTSSDDEYSTSQDQQHHEQQQQRQASSLSMGHKEVAVSQFSSSSVRSDIKSTFQIDHGGDHFERLLRLLDKAERIRNSKHGN